MARLIKEIKPFAILKCAQFPRQCGMQINAIRDAMYRAEPPPACPDSRERLALIVEDNIIKDLAVSCNGATRADAVIISDLAALSDLTARADSAALSDLAMCAERAIIPEY